MIKVIAEGKDGILIVEMSKSDLYILQCATGVESDERSGNDKVGMRVDSQKISELSSAFYNLSSLKSGLKEMLTKWQTVLAKIEMTEEIAKKK